MAVSVVNREILNGFRFICTPDVLESGPAYEMAAEKAAGMGMPKPYAVVILRIEEIHSLKPGPTAGKRID